MSHSIEFPSAPRSRPAASASDQAASRQRHDSARCMMRALMWACAMILGFGAIGVPSASASSTAPDPTVAAFPYDLSIRGAYGTADVVLPVPQGSSPRIFSGSITSSYTTAGDLLLLINDRVAATVPAVGGGKFSVKLSGADVGETGVAVGLRADLGPNRNCFRDDLAVATVENANLRFDDVPAPPDTLAAFLAPGANGFVVAIPAAAGTAEQTAGLNAVLALRHISGPRTSVVLRTDAAPPPTTVASRTVVVDPATGDASVNALTLQDGRLHITGDSDGLAAAAVSLADPNVSLLQVSSVSNLSGEADYAAVTQTANLRRLGVASLAVSGIGRVSQVVNLSQAAFGAPISQLIINLSGTATPVLPGQQGRVNVKWNDRMVSSQALAGDSRVAMDFAISAENLRSVNYLELELEYLPAGADCSSPALPGRVEIDVARSEVAPSFGSSTDPGFQRFPQAFGPTIAVSADGVAAQSLPNLAAVLDAAVASSPLQYTVEVVDVTALAERAGVAIGVSPAQADNLGAPLPDEQTSATFPAGAQVPYAALQAFQSNGNNLILLSAEPARAATELAQWPSAEDGGWSSLSGQVYVMSDDTGIPQVFAAASTLPDKRTPQLIAAGIISLLLASVLILWVRHRPAER